MRVKDIIEDFKYEDMFSADKRKRFEELLQNCCYVTLMGSYEKDPKWRDRFNEFGQLTDMGIEVFDRYDGQC